MMVKKTWRKRLTAFMITAKRYNHASPDILTTSVDRSVTLERRRLQYSSGSETRRQLLLPVVVVPGRCCDPQRGFVRRVCCDAQAIQGTAGLCWKSGLAKVSSLLVVPDVGRVFRAKVSMQSFADFCSGMRLCGGMPQNWERSLLHTWLDKVDKIQEVVVGLRACGKGKLGQNDECKAGFFPPVAQASLPSGLLQWDGSGGHCRPHVFPLCEPSNST